MAGFRAEKLSVISSTCDETDADRLVSAYYCVNCNTFIHISWKYLPAIVENTKKIKVCTLGRAIFFSHRAIPNRILHKITKKRFTKA